MFKDLSALVLGVGLGAAYMAAMGIAAMLASLLS